jgi:hypothetical protein
MAKAAIMRTERRATVGAELNALGHASAGYRAACTAPWSTHGVSVFDCSWLPARKFARFHGAVPQGETP